MQLGHLAAERGHLPVEHGVLHVAEQQQRRKGGHGQKADDGKGGHLTGLAHLYLGAGQLPAADVFPLLGLGAAVLFLLPAGQPNGPALIGRGIGHASISIILCCFASAGGHTAHSVSHLLPIFLRTRGPMERKRSLLCEVT